MLRLYGADNEEITYDQPTQVCGNPACLGESWCSAWGICKDAAMYDDIAGVDTSESSLAISTHGRSELEIDAFFLQASQAFESSSRPAPSMAMRNGFALEVRNAQDG